MLWRFGQRGNQNGPSSARRPGCLPPHATPHNSGLSRRVRRAGWASVTLSVVLAAVLLVASPAHSAPLYVGWSPLLPAWTTAYSPSSADDCVAGREQCVQQVIRRMQRQYQQARASCDHRSAFALAYLRTTQQFQRANTQPGFFSDPAFLNHQDAVFAQFYFTAAQAWGAGQLDQVPQAWRVAFQAAARREVSAVGDMMLGMNAHVTRDLPYVLAAIGLNKPDGSSRKPDHDQVNVFLNQVVQPLLEEMATTLDPSADDADTPLSLSYTAVMQLLVAWREQAWRHAEQLAHAGSAAQQRNVAASIETSATANALAVRRQFAYVAPLTSTTTRDQFCAAQR